MSAETAVECVVVGAGPVGLAAAAALATIGVDVALAGGDVPLGRVAEDAAQLPGACDAHSASSQSTSCYQDTRTAALFPASIALLRRLGAWDAAAKPSAALLAIRIIDATGGLLRAPELLFSAAEIGWPGFGFNVPQTALSRGLRQALDSAKVRVLSGGPVVALTPAGASSGSCSSRAASSGRSTQTRLDAAFGRAPDRVSGSGTVVHGPAGVCNSLEMP